LKRGAISQTKRKKKELLKNMRKKEGGQGKERKGGRGAEKEIRQRRGKGGNKPKRVAKIVGNGKIREPGVRRKKKKVEKNKKKKGDQLERRKRGR